MIHRFRGGRLTVARLELSKEKRSVDDLPRSPPCLACSSSFVHLSYLKMVGYNTLSRDDIIAITSLHKAGHATRAVSEQTGVSVCQIQRYVKRLVETEDNKTPEKIKTTWQNPLDFPQNSENSLL